MKKLFLLSIFTVFTLVFSSCSKDEDGVSNASESKITGSWNLTARYKLDETLEIFGATTSVSATYNMTLTK